MASVNEKGKREWDLSGRKLKSLPASLLTQGEEARIVDLQRNRLKQVRDISMLVHLRELNLSRNEMEEFPQEMGQLSHLERLYMNQNNIRSIPENVFPHLRKLEFLKLSTNHLTELPPDLNQCTSLTYLSLSKNRLTDLRAVVGLPHLKELLVEKNRLTELPPQLFQRESCVLTLCKATGNPLKCPPEEVCLGGIKDIQNYFGQLEATPHKRMAWTIKTMFLGSSMAGKSTLCRSLKEGKPVEVEEEDRTEGIEISQLSVQEVRFLLWDFAGQEEYYLTHHVFITPQAFVILAVNLASYSIKDPQSFKDQVWFWIINIQLRVPNSVVLLVGTHCDQCRDDEEVAEKKKHIDQTIRDMLEARKVVLKRLRENLEDDDPTYFSDQVTELDDLLECTLQVQDLLAIDCTRDEHIARLTRHILKHIRSEGTFPCAQRILPRSYEEVEQTIRKLVTEEEIPQHGIVAFEDLSDLILKHTSLSSESLYSILRYLHRIGVIVWYEAILALSDKVFVQPSFLISLFKTIVRPNLVRLLEDIPKRQLVEEGTLMKEKALWVDDFTSRGTLHNPAIRILARRELRRLGVEGDEDLVKEVVGTKREEGILLSLLQHFEVCLPAQIGSPLNPQAPLFIPGGKQWESPSLVKRDPNGACLFPSYLQNNKVVFEKWGLDHRDDVNVHVYFQPEIPHGFFHRLVVRMCSLYPTHWVGKDQCLLCCGNKLVLVKQRSKEEDDSFIEIRCKRPAKKDEFRPSWDLILAVMSKLFVLSRQWPGLAQQVHSPCPEKGCQHYFLWRDWQDLTSDTDIYDCVLLLGEKLVCKGGHTRRTELIFPKVPSDST